MFVEEAEIKSILGVGFGDGVVVRVPTAGLFPETVELRVHGCICKSKVIILKGGKRMALDVVSVCAPKTLVVDRVNLCLDPSVFFRSAQRRRGILLLNRGRNLALELLQSFLDADFIAEIHISSDNQHLYLLNFLLDLALDALLPILTHIAVNYAFLGFVVPGYFDGGGLILLEP